MYDFKAAPEGRGIEPNGIKNEKDYEDALKRIDSLMDKAAPGSPEEDELDILTYLVDKYEDEHFPVDIPDPVTAIKFRIEQLGLDRKDLEKCLGGKAKVSEILSRKRQLSLNMIRRLNEHLKIPAEILIKKVALF